ncbi:MAG: hypothetical protein H0V01_00155 [Bacteroidetes bacterium]|nr:hypothetical protein [Bacteroidota bacterium]HET6244931.1 hypothetical protein [Bacteroidia bacterium]
MLSIRTTIYLLSFSLIIQGCNFVSPKDEQVPVARVHDRFLYKTELESVISPGLSQEDSVAKANSYINNWIRQTLIYSHAEKNLSEDQKMFEQKLEDYKRSLIIYTFERELIDQILDTIVTREQIEFYYDQNKQNFELKDNIIKVRYIKVDKSAPDLEKVKVWYKSNKEIDLIALENYAYQFAQNFFLDENNWLLFEDLLKEIPILTYNKEEFLKNNRFVEVEDSVSYYFVNIRGFKIKNSISPMNFEMDNIRNILINKRKIELINKMKNDIYEKALQANDIEIFEGL